MEMWKATIKERGKDNLLTPTYSFCESSFGYIKDERQREYVTMKYLCKFWGLDNPDVEWYKLEKI